MTDDSRNECPPERLSKQEERFFDLFLHDLFHIDEVRLALYNLDECTAEERKFVEEHLKDCSVCRKDLERMREVIRGS